MPKSRPDGAGTKDRHRSGKIRIRVRVDGNRVTRTFADEAEADSFLHGAQVMAASGERSIQAPTLATWGAQWIASLTNKSADDDASRWRSLLAPAPIAQLELRDIGRPDVVAYLAWLARQKRQVNVEGPGRRKHASAKAKGDEPISPQTRKHGLALLRRCLGAAADQGIIPVNPAIGVRPCRQEQQAVRRQPWTFLKQAEIAQVVTCAQLDERTRLRYQAAIYTGLRQGDLWALDWCNLDLPRGQLSIIIEKTGEPLSIPLLPPALDALRRLHELAGEPAAGLVFPAPMGGRRGETDDGGWATSRCKGKVVAGHKELAGITRRVRFHDLRHTMVSHLLRGTWGRKWSIVEVKEYVGHSSITVTQRYAHMEDALSEAAAQTSGSQVGRSPEPTSPPFLVGGPGGIRTHDQRLKSSTWSARITGCYASL